MARCAVLIALLFTSLQALAHPPQRIEGFDQIAFRHTNLQTGRPARDFLGDAVGDMTAAWWMPGQAEQGNYVSWKTAVVPRKEATTFVFVGGTSVLPPELARGPEATLSIDGHNAVTFTLGANRDMVWKNGDYELKYTSKRVEYPFFGSHRELRELNGNSGVFEFSVPASAVEAGAPAELKVTLHPFERWNGGWFMVKERRDVLKPTTQSLQGQIDALQQDMQRTNELIEILATQLYNKTTANDGIENQIIYTSGFHHVHPADLIKLRNGDLLLMFREGSEHISIDGDVVMLRSRDNGRTWSDRQVIAGIKNLDEREGCGLQLKDGTIVVGIFFNNLYNSDGGYKTKGEHPHPELPGLGTYIITSKDDGHTWSPPKVIDFSHMPFTGMEGPTDAPIEMPDGSLLMGVIGYGIDKDPKNVGAVMLKSVDSGQSWTYLSTIASDPGGKLGGLVEPGIVCSKTGRLIAAMRNDHSGAVYRTYSDDAGKTWAPALKTSIFGGPVDLVQLADGRIMATYGVRPNNSMPAGIRACFSSDDGLTFDPATEVQIRNDFVNWDVGYPESLMMDGDKVFTVYYYNMFGRYFIGGSYWRLPGTK